MNKHGAQNTGKTIKRILSYMKKYKFRFIFVLICILLSAVANVAGSMFIGTLIDDYITPLLGSTNPVFTGLLKAICVMGIVYLVGILATLFYNRTMVSIAQGVLKKIRDDMFTHMQKLPIKYFDTHTHGDIMSYYTNDTDTLRQMMAQSIPQMFSSAVTIISVVRCDVYIECLSCNICVGVCDLYDVCNKENCRSERKIFCKTTAVHR